MDLTMKLFLICFVVEMISTYDLELNDSKLNCLHWTPWLSAGRPTLSGEWETISAPDDMGFPGTINSYFKGTPVCTLPVSIECRSRSTNISWTDLYDELRVPCLANQGLVCRTQDQHYNRICQDYEVRFLCWRQCDYFKWSPWLNSDSPEGEGDIELLGETISREAWPCEGGEIPVDVQVETTSEIPVHQSKKRGLRCHQFGFACLNVLQSPQCPCNDYKIRFLCPVARQLPLGYIAPPLQFP